MIQDLFDFSDGHDLSLTSIAFRSLTVSPMKARVSFFETCQICPGFSGRWSRLLLVREPDIADFRGVSLSGPGASRCAAKGGLMSPNGAQWRPIFFSGAAMHCSSRVFVDWLSVSGHLVFPQWPKVFFPTWVRRFVRVSYVKFCK